MNVFRKYKTQIKYLIFGLLTTVVDFVISFILYKFVNHHIANTAAWCGAVVFAYVVNKIFVFESKRSCFGAVAAEFCVFVGSRLLSFLLQEGIFVFAVDVMDFDKTLTKVGAMLIVFVANYIFGKLIFSKKEKADKV